MCQEHITALLDKGMYTLMMLHRAGAPDGFSWLPAGMAYHWELNSGPPEEWPVFLTGETPLQVFGMAHCKNDL